MGKKTTHLKRAAQLMVRYANKGAIFTNQQRDLILSLFIVGFIVSIPYNMFWEHFNDAQEREKIAKERAEMKRMIQEALAQQNDTIMLYSK